MQKKDEETMMEMQRLTGKAEMQVMGEEMQMMGVQKGEENKESRKEESHCLRQRAMEKKPKLTMSQSIKDGGKLK